MKTLSPTGRRRRSDFKDLTGMQFGRWLVLKVIKRSGRYFLGGRVLTLAQVKREMPTERILIGNMEGNGWAKVVINDNSWRTCQPLEKDDVILDYKVATKKAKATA